MGYEANLPWNITIMSAISALYYFQTSLFHFSNSSLSGSQLRKCITNLPKTKKLI